MKIVKHTLLNIFVICFVSISPSFAYEEANLEKVMTELKSTNSALFKKAEKVYKYSTSNTNEIIDKPLLTKQQALNGFVDRTTKCLQNSTLQVVRVKAKFVMLFKFDGKNTSNRKFH